MYLGFGVVGGIWFFLVLVVGINIGVDEPFHFYGPAGFGKPPSVFVAGLVLTPLQCRVLDSVSLLSSAHCG